MTIRNTKIRRPKQVDRQQRARAGNSRSAQQEQQEHLGILCLMIVMMMRRRRCLQHQRARADLRRRRPNVIPFQQARQHQQQEL
jgi:hypothetical protein